MTIVPCALAGTNQRSQLVDLLTESVQVESKLPDSEAKACLLIDGPALIQAIGKPDRAKTFGDLSDVFCRNIWNNFGSVYSRTDVVFDHYNDQFIKSGTRAQRAGCVRSIRRVISSKNTQLPSNWKSFVSSSANKDDLAEFLSGALKKKAAKLNNEYEHVIGRGFDNILEVWSSKGRDIENLKSSHEEADTRLILHANDAYMNGYQKIVLQCRDTDILILALAFKGQLSQEIWMSAGTVNKSNTYQSIKLIFLTLY